MTQEDIAERIGISEDGVKKQLANLKECDSSNAWEQPEAAIGKSFKFE